MEIREELRLILKANEILCKVRGTFDQYNLISGLHSFMSEENKIYKNV